MIKIFCYPQSEKQLRILMIFVNNQLNVFPQLTHVVVISKTYWKGSIWKQELVGYRFWHNLVFPASS
ncbi:hypothetical protein O6P43_010603 [Quillaja saponaria]|uniref:Uncharacterized protein n=1 Tax=Quillaja saponaria TaxID=32244 RepID=A0AAD7Q0T9_QUISA|nr:hypothetical protein O6P43_010603 [Quillaja saponaria]